MVTVPFGTGLAASLVLLFWNWDDLLLAGRGKRLWPVESHSSQMSMLETGLGEGSAANPSQQIAAFNPSGAFCLAFKSCAPEHYRHLLST